MIIIPLQIICFSCPKAFRIFSFLLEFHFQNVSGGGSFLFHSSWHLVDSIDLKMCMPLQCLGMLFWPLHNLYYFFTFYFFPEFLMGVFRLILNVLYFFLHIVLYLVDMHSEGFSELQVFSYGIVLAMTLLRILFLTFYFILEYIGLPYSSNSKGSACSAVDQGLVPGLGRSSEESYGNPLQYSCLENPMDRGAWRATVCGVIKSWT